jgi:hypothetical protein
MSLLFTGKQSKLYGNLVEFGRRTNSVEKENYGKWKEKSYRAIMVGYAKNHSADTTDCIIQ